MSDSIQITHIAVKGSALSIADLVDYLRVWFSNPDVKIILAPQFPKIHVVIDDVTDGSATLVIE